MKRGLSLILTLVMVIGIITSVPVAVSAAGEEVFTFESYGSYCYVSASSTDISGEIIIPGEYNGLPVTGVINFQNCPNVTSIVISDGVEEIGWSAFKGCTNLTTVTIGKDVRDTGMGTFTGCNSLTDIFVDEDNEYHASQDGVLFNKDKTMLIQYPLGKADKVYTIPDAVTDIFQGSFRESVNLESVIISGSVTTIDPFAFAFSNKLKSVIISDGVQSIDSMAFVGCPELKEVAIPGSVTTIGENAFGYYYSETYELLKGEDFKIFGVKGSAAETYANENGFEFIESSEVIEESVLTFELNEDGESYSVTGCDKSAEGELVIPDTYNDLPVTKIGASALSDCDKLISITIPDSVKCIGSFAFASSDMLKTIIIGTERSKLETVGDYLAEECWALEKVVFYGTKSQWNNINFGELNYSLLNSAIVCMITCEHPNTVWLTDQEATVYKAGSKHQECTECGETLKTATIKQLTCAKPVLKEVYNANSYVKVTWGTVKGADKYYVYRKTGTGDYEYIGSTTNTYFNDKEAGAGKTCRYIVKAKNEAGNSEASASIAIKHVDEPTLKSIENSAYGVLIKWDKITGAEKYNVYRKVSGGEYKYIGATSKTYYTDKTAKSGTKYYYAIRAKKDDSISSQSASLSKYYLADPTLKTPTSTTSGIKLSWSKVTGAEGYMVYRKTGSGSYTKIKTEKGVSNLSYTDSSAKKGKKYTYKIKAYKSSTYSAYSNTKAITDKY